MVVVSPIVVVAVVIRSDSEGGEVYVHKDGVGALTGSGLADELGFFLFDFVVVEI
ncbi:hypothetical protein HanXRQr2_Chr04g0182901 [Helianthus annuus]|uniref:Uncharacterized protein n=1 Tax=Helianthus annuus TaxID=4232 RepID=A0A9K3JBR0_HELAN|nr:hypothetical protein HanXRQr2_Chr04g0182901 [Helianthus annuus]KAJ0932679.1 hypothetical protein HanPSC8_Chr04g0176401 [Helianthus annuus]